MKQFSKNLLGSKLTITINTSSNIDEKIINSCFSETKNFENKYSRFIKGNFLDNLNKNKSSQATGELLSIIKLSKKVSKITDGYFDITVLPFLENIGYGKEENHLEENYGYENIEINENEIILKNGVSIDIGGLGKGFIVDKIYNTLDPIFDDFIINFGGDIKVKAKHKILLEDPFDDKKVLGEIFIKNSSIASSSPNKRKTKKGNHLINPKDKKQKNDKLAIYITHNLSSFSDTFSTALFITPLDKTLEILNKINGLEALIIAGNGEIFKTKGFECNLYKN